MGIHPVDGNAARLCQLAALAVVLAACSSSGKEPVEEPNIFPGSARAEVLATLSGSLADQTNVRDAFITDPVLTQAGRDQRYTICVRYNARNANREYRGNKDSIGYFYAGHLTQLVDATPEQCGKAAYKPFPELEKLCQAKKCE